MDKSSLQQVLGRLDLIKRFYYFESVDSTMERARKLCAEGEGEFHHGGLLIANYQSLGRGRHGRSWGSPPGKSLLLTLILSQEAVSLNNSDQYASAACAFPVALCRGINRFVPEARIKYPNDIVIGGRKLAGLLVEAYKGYLLIGIGVNCSQEVDDFPNDLRMPASSLYLETGKLIKREHLLQEIVVQITQLLEDDALSQSIVQLNALCESFGQVLCIDLGTQVISGLAERVDDFGRLVITTAEGERLLYSSEIVRTWLPDSQSSAEA